jgi:hypothetical protein
MERRISFAHAMRTQLAEGGVKLDPVLAHHLGIKKEY